jgi:hypothetical protein
MVEISLALPFLVVIVMALIEFGMVLAAYLSLVNATREGAVFASEYSQLADSNCNPDSNPNAYPLPEGTSGYCTGAHDDDPVSGSGTTSSTLWSEYYQRVSNEVYAPIGQPLEQGGLLNQDILTVDRPLVGTLQIPPCPSGSTTGLDAGCPITVTVHFRVHTLTSGISLPGFGRMGLPPYYQINYTYAMPIR